MFPLLVAATYVVAPIPNWVCSRFGNPDDFIESSGSAVVDFGRFFTGFLVLMGIGMPLLIQYSMGEQNEVANSCYAALPSVLAHSGAIEVPAMIMSIFGGLLIYGTIISFSLFFREQEEF